MEVRNRELQDTIVSFINSIGIPCKAGSINSATFLPGVDINNGSIIYDIDKMANIGDLLHEAGHIAVLKPDFRSTVSSPDVSGDLDAGGAEMAAIAWSWAALKHIDIAPGVVFHEHGYHDGSEAIIENFSNQRYFGVSLLQWFGMTYEPKHAATKDLAYPAMKHWLRP